MLCGVSRRPFICAVTVLGIISPAPTTRAEEQSACRNAECRSVQLPQHSAHNFPVLIRIKGVEFVIALDDCLAIVKRSAFDSGKPLQAALEYYAVAREVLPPSSTIDLGERSGDDLEQFLATAVGRGVAYGFDPKTAQAIPELRICSDRGLYPCGDGGKGMCGCSRDDYCLPGGRFLFSGVGICT